MTVDLLLRVLVFAGAMAIPIVAVQIVTFVLLRRYATRFVDGVEKVSRVALSHDLQVLEISRLLHAAAALLAETSSRLSPSPKA